MALSENEILSLMKVAFPQAKIELNDMAGDADHYELIITDHSFQGKSRIQQHKMVYQALQGKMGHELHALKLQTKIPN